MIFPFALKLPLRAGVVFTVLGYQQGIFRFTAAQLRILVDGCCKQALALIDPLNQCNGDFSPTGHDHPVPSTISWIGEARMLVGRTTDRLRWFRERMLQPDETRLLDDVGKYGCHVIRVREEGGFPGWSYTVGLTEVLGYPELIVLGLKPDVAHSLLNECAGRLQQGIRLQEGGRANGLLSNVECEFRAIEKRWIKQTMGYGVWFYGGVEFAVLQCVYPDLNNRFPWDEDFDPTWRSRQPLLFPNSLNPNVEHDFWAANDPNSSLHNWRFTDSPHTGVFTTKRVMSGEDSVTRVFHDINDGAWQFHGPRESNPEDIAYVCLHHVIDRDASIGELHDLPLGWCAWRQDVKSPWKRELAPHEAEETSSEPSTPPSC